MLKKSAILIAFILLVLPAAGARADTADEALLCGELSPADCEIRLSNQAVMDAVYSFAFSLSANMEVEAADPSDSLNMSMSGAGRLSYDQGMKSQLEAMEAQEALDAAEMASLVETAFGGMTGELSLLITLDVEGEIEEVPLDILLKEGVIALDFAALTGESAGGDMSMGWLGISFAGLADLFEAEGAFAESVGALPADLSHSAMAQSMTITRLADSDVNGVSTAVFQTVLDTDALREIFDMAGMAKDEADAQTAALHVIEYVGLADFLTHRVDLVMTDVPNSDAEGLGAVVSMDMRIDVSGFNEPVDISLPDDMMIMPLSMMMPMGQ